MNVNILRLFTCSHAKRRDALWDPEMFADVPSLGAAQALLAHEETAGTLASPIGSC